MDRRQFLKTVAIGAGTVLVPSTALALLTEKSFHPGFDGKCLSLVWRGDNYHCYYTDKTFIVAHKAKGSLPHPADCPDLNLSHLKKNSFDHLLDKNRISIKTKQLLEMIDKSGNTETKYQTYTDVGEVLDLYPGDCVDRLTGVGLLSVLRYTGCPDYRYFTSKYREEWTGVNINAVRNMLKSAPPTISMALNNKTLSFASPDGSWAAFLAVLEK